MAQRIAKRKYKSRICVVQFSITIYEIFFRIFSLYVKMPDVTTSSVNSAEKYLRRAKANHKNAQKNISET